MLTRYRYDCSCGWSHEEAFGGFQAAQDVLPVVEHILQQDLHPRARAVWEQLQRHPLILKEKDRPGRGVLDIPSFLKRAGKHRQEIKEAVPPYVHYHMALSKCPSCRIAAKQWVVYPPDAPELLHEHVCFRCSGPMERFTDVEHISCPCCSQPVKAERMKFKPINQGGAIDDIDSR